MSDLSLLCNGYFIVSDAIVVNDDTFMAAAVGYIEQLIITAELVRIHPKSIAPCVISINEIKP